MEEYGFEYYTVKTWRERLDGLPFGIVYALSANLVATAPATWWPDALLFMVCPLIAHGMLYLFTHWSIQVNVWIAYRRQISMEEATHVLIRPPAESRRSAQLATKVVENELTWVMFEQRKLMYDDGKFSFLKAPNDASIQSYCQRWRDGGLTLDHANQLQILYGRNSFDIPLPDFYDLFREHAVSPFFVFQMFCVLLWLMDEYWYYSILTAVMLVVLEGQLVKRRLHDLEELRRMRIPPRPLCVWRDRSWQLVSSDRLVPGDIATMYASQTEDCVPCDMLLLQGSVLVDEAMLTGESAPQLKSAIDGDGQLERRWCIIETPIIRMCRTRRL